MYCIFTRFSFYKNETRKEEKVRMRKRDGERIFLYTFELISKAVAEHCL